MTRTELYKEKRKGIAKTEYIFIERLNDLSEQVQALTERVDRMSEHLYFFAKTDREELKNAFDEQFEETWDSYDELFETHGTERIKKVL